MFFVLNRLATLTVEETIVVSKTDSVGGLEDDVVADKAADTTQQGAENQPHQDSGAVFGNGDVVTGSVVVQTVLDLIHPIVAVETAGYDAQQDVHTQATDTVAVLGTNLIDVLSQLVDRVVAVNTTGYDGQEDVHNKTVVGLDGGTVDVTSIASITVALRGGVARVVVVTLRSRVARVAVVTLRRRIIRCACVGVSRRSGLCCTAVGTELSAVIQLRAAIAAELHANSSLQI